MEGFWNNVKYLTAYSQFLCWRISNSVGVDFEIVEVFLLINSMVFVKCVFVGFSGTGRTSISECKV